MHAIRRRFADDANDWAREHKAPRYILDLILSVVDVSVWTVEIMDAASKLKFDFAERKELKWVINQAIRLSFVRMNFNNSSVATT